MDTSYSLISAVQEGRLKRVRELISSFDLSYSPAWSEEYVLLCDAVKNKHTAVTKLLLTSGSKVNCKNQKPSNTPLHFAVINGDIEIVEVLLQHDADINASDKYGRTALHFTALSEGKGLLGVRTSKEINNIKGEIAKLLLSRGANVDAQDKDGKTILHLAVEKGYPVIIEHILKYCPDVNNKNNRSSLNAAVHGYGSQYSKIVESLLQYGFSVNPEDINNYKLLHAAVEKGYLKIVEDLLKYGTDINMLFKFKFNFKSYTPLHIATKNKQEKVATLLINYGADVNAKDEVGNTPIFYAIENTDLKITKLLLTNGADIKYPKLLNTAVKKKCREIVEVLLQHDADINASDKYGRTALHFTASSGYESFWVDLLDGSSGFCIKKDTDNIKGEIAKLLLSRGANVDAQDKDGISTLHIASREGYSKVVEALLEYNANVNSQAEYDLTRLHLSVDERNEVVTTMLLNKGADVNAKDKVGNTPIFKFMSYTPLHIATKNKQEKVATLLINYGADVNAKDEVGNTPIFYAIENTDLKITKLLLTNGADIKDPKLLNTAVKKKCREIVEVLLQHDADINASDKYGRTALHFTGSSFRYSTDKDPDINIMGEIAKLLLSRGANVDAQDKDGISTLHIASREGYSKVVEALLEYNANVNSQAEYDLTRLHLSVDERNEVVTTMLLNKGADVNAKDEVGNTPIFKFMSYTPLHIATKNKQEKVATLLINYGADVNAKDEVGNTPIFYAIENTDLKITKLLLTNGADIKDPELLNTAVEKECREIVEVLLQHDADINASNKYGRTALHFTASSFGFPTNKDSDINIKGEIAKLLLSRGANVDAQDKKGISTLHFAIRKGHAKVVEALLEYNANVNSQADYDITPLHLSVNERNEVITTMLLNKGANVNAEQKDGLTALHIATRNGYKEVVEALLKCGAKVDFKVKRSDTTPLTIAAEEGYLEIIKILLKFGADINSRHKCGRTALHVASEKGYAEIVEALLEYGSDINIVTKCNRTSLDSIDMASYDSDDDVYDRYYTYKATAGILKQQIIKMKTANLYVCKENLLSISSDDGLSDYQYECEEEMESMKSEISNTNVSFHDILTKNISQLAIYARNENIVQVLKSDDFERKFPIYASMINNRFRKGVERKELLEQGNRFFHSLFNRLPELPYYCTEKIFSYLSDKDLRFLIDVCEHIQYYS